MQSVRSSSRQLQRQKLDCGVSTSCDLANTFLIEGGRSWPRVTLPPRSSRQNLLKAQPDQANRTGKDSVIRLKMEHIYIFY